MPAKLIRMWWILAGALILLLITAPVSANSAAHFSAWFIFANDQEPAPGLVGAQLIFCDTSDCNAPSGVLQYEVCNAPQCVSANRPDTKWFSSFGCDARKCYYWTYQSAPIRLVAQFADGAAVSVSLPPGGFTAVNYRVTRAGDRLVLTPMQANLPSGYGGDLAHWLVSFLLTEVVELVIAFVLLKFLFHLNHAILKQALILIAFVNLVTHPIIWFVFPSFMKWYPESEFGIGASVIIFTAILTAALFIVRYLHGRLRIVLTTLSGALFIIAVPCSLLFWFSFAYSAQARVSVSGWSVEQTLLFAETFAVVAETVLLWLLMRRQIPFWQIAMMSLVANLASFGLGMVLAPMI